MKKKILLKRIQTPSVKFWSFDQKLCLKHSVLDFKTENILTMWTKWPCLCECQWCNMIQPKLSNKWQRTVLNFQSHDKLAFHSNNRFPSKGSPFSHLICKCKSSNSIFAMFCTYRLITTICDKLKCLNRHRSKSITVTKLSFCQNGPPMSTTFWQKKRLVTLILFDLCLFKHFSLSQIFVISLY